MNGHNDNKRLAEDFDVAFPSNDEWDELGLTEGLADLLAFDDTAGPQDDFDDDLARRRWVHEVIARYEEDEAEKQDAPATSTNKLIYVAFAAAAAIGVVAGGLGTITLMENLSTEEPAVAVAEALPYSAESTLVAGNATVGDRALLPGQELQAGDEIVVQDGRVALGLPSNIDLLLEKGSHLHIKKLDSDGFEVDLKDGSVLASVDPKAERPGFAVNTDAGTVTVTGTIFSVRAGETSDVRVLRGSVRVNEPGRSPRSVKTMQGSVLGGDELRTLDEDEAAALKERAVGLDVLQSANDSGTIVIKSDPAGASVSIDGVVVGTTPLTADVAPGSHPVRLSLEGHTPTRHLVEVGKKGVVTKNYTLAPAAVAIKIKDDDTAEPRVKSAATLLKQANTHRKNRNWAAAARSYELLIRDHPRSGEARTARVSLADIELNHLGNPRQALRHYNVYLKRANGGVVAQEARYGRIRALRSLGRTSHEKAAIEEFLKKHRTSLYSKTLQKRLDKLEGK